jgi:hypothetical protein
MNDSDTSLSALWDEVTGTQPAPPSWLVLTAAGIALLVVLAPASWRISRNAVTIAHEGGHALIAVLTGRRLTAVRLHSDTSGLTVSRGKPTGLGMVLTAVAGYIAPSLLGLGGAWLLSGHRITALLWISIVLLVLLLIMIRNAYGVLSLIVTGGLVFVVSWFAGPEVQAAFAYLAVWFLLLGGVRPVIELQAKRHRREAPDSDADQLQRLTHLPALLWVLFFGAVSLLSLAGAAQWLLGG